MIIPALLVPVMLCFLLIVPSMIEHSVRRYSVVLQGIYLRIILLFPLISVLVYIGGSVPHAMVWSLFAISFIESYVFILFFAIMILWAQEKGDVCAALMRSKATNTRYYFCKSWGPEHKSGRSALRSYFYQTCACLLVKPILAGVNVIAESFDAKLSFMFKFFVLGSINLIAIIISMLALIRLYMALSGKKQTNGEEKGTDLLQGLGFGAKFVIVKLLLWAVFLNEGVFEPMIKANIFNAPDWMCPEFDTTTQTGDEQCDKRLIALIFDSETFILAVLAVLLFRPSHLFEVRESEVLGKGTFCRTWLQLFKVWDIFVLPFKAVDKLQSEDIELAGTNPDKSFPHGTAQVAEGSF